MLATHAALIALFEICTRHDGSPCSQAFLVDRRRSSRCYRTEVNPPIRPCADLRACGHDPQAVAKARAREHTCRTPPVRARWHCLALPLLCFLDAADL